MSGIPDARLGLVGQLLPAIADRHAKLFQPPQQRCRVLQIDVVIRRRTGHGIVEVTDVRVIAGDHRVQLAKIELQQCAVPPQMMDQVVAELPMHGLRRQPVAPFRGAAIRVEDVRLHMVGEVVVRIVLHRGIHRGLRAGGVADFLMGERPERCGSIMTRQVGAPGPARGDRPAPGSSQSGHGESRWYRKSAKPAGRSDGRPVSRARPRMPGPALQPPTPPTQRHEPLTPRSRSARPSAADRAAAIRARYAGFDAEQQQIALQAMRHQEMRIALQRLPDQAIVSAWYFR